jgi:hypothetical protein
MAQKTQETSETAALTVQSDITCNHCGYNLRGLFPEGNCPECGESIARSLRGNLLRFADPRWLRRVHLGLGVIFYTVVIGYILQNVAAFFLTMWGQWPLLPRGLAPAVISILTFAGAMLVTRRERRTAVTHETTKSRRAVRVIAVIDILYYISSQIVAVHALSGAVHATIAQLLPIVLLEAFYFALFGLLAEFAERIPNARRATRARTMRWAFLMAGVLLIAGELIWDILVAGSADPRAIDWLWPFLILTTNLLALAVDAWAMIVLWPIRREFRKAITIPTAFAGDQVEPSG